MVKKRKVKLKQKSDFMRVAEALWSGEKHPKVRYPHYPKRRKK